MGVALYEAQLSAEVLVKSNLAALTPLSALVLYGAGLLTSLTPCCLSMLPLTFAYIGGIADEEQGGTARSSLLPAVAFSSGLAVAFAVGPSTIVFLPTDGQEATAPMAAIVQELEPLAIF